MYWVRLVAYDIQSFIGIVDGGVGVAFERRVMVKVRFCRRMVIVGHDIEEIQIALSKGQSID